MPLPAAILVLLGALLAFLPAPGLTAEGPAAPVDISPILEPLREAARLPAIVAAVVRDGRIAGIGAVGVRKVGTGDHVLVTDPFHIGSDTKAMTATVAAMLVEDGVIGWNTTVAEVFPGEKEIDPVCRTITLEQLLNHRSGLPHAVDSRLPFYDAAWQDRYTTVEQRRILLRDVLSRSYEHSPGTKFLYSDVGYIIAGAMMEERAGLPWRTLLRTRLFKPLGMRSAGFGYPARISSVFGHRPDKEGRNVPVEAGPDDDDPAAFGPAGIVHCSVEDWAKFAIFHLKGAREDTPLLKRTSFIKLHTPPAGQEFAMGWVAVPRMWAAGMALSHAGSNGAFLALAWLAPERNFGVLVLTNSVGPEAETACDKAVVALIRQSHLPVIPSAVGFPSPSPSFSTPAGR